MCTDWGSRWNRIIAHGTMYTTGYTTARNRRGASVKEYRNGSTRYVKTERGFPIFCSTGIARCTSSAVAR